MTSDRHRNTYIDGAACFWTSSIVEWLPVLKSPAAAQCLIKIWDEYRGRYGIRIIGYVIMPDHIHIIVWAEKSIQVIRFLEQSLRKTSREIGKMTEDAAGRGNTLAARWLDIFRAHRGSGAKLAVWKERGRAFPITSGDELRQKLQYIHENPVRRRLVERAEDWHFSSARWYLDGTGPLSMDTIDGW